MTLTPLEQAIRNAVTQDFLSARYRMCKSPLEELEERQAKEFERIGQKSAERELQKMVYEIGLRHAAERAELEGRK